MPETASAQRARFASKRESVASRVPRTMLGPRVFFDSHFRKLRDATFEAVSRWSMPQLHWEMERVLKQVGCCCSHVTAAIKFSALRGFARNPKYPTLK
jgi:hypothetical protein